MRNNLWLWVILAVLLVESLMVQGIAEWDVPTVIGGGNGSIGPQGPQGPQGIPGADGIDGTNGTNGVNFTFSISNNSITSLITNGSLINFTAGPGMSIGIFGKTVKFTCIVSPGINGTNGADGATGPQGPQGIPGIQGANGTNGINGANGTSLNGTRSISFFTSGLLQTLQLTRDDGLMLNATFNGTNVTIENNDSTLASSYVVLPGLIVIRLNATRRSIQTFPGDTLVTAADTEGQKWASKTWNGSALTVKSYPKYVYDPILGTLNETYAYWDMGFTSVGANNPHIDFSVGVPFFKETYSNKADIYVRIKMSGGSAIGAQCPDADTFPSGFYQNITIMVNSPGALNITSLTIPVNDSFYNWTNIKLPSVSLGGVRVTQDGLTNSIWRASVIAREKTPSLIPNHACFGLEQIVVEQYNG